MKTVIRASTCAFGSHRCRPYIGTFTMNSIMQASYRRILNQELDIVWTQYLVIRKFNETIAFRVEIRAMRNSRHPTSAQNRK